MAMVRMSSLLRLVLKWAGLVCLALPLGGLVTVEAATIQKGMVRKAKIKRTAMSPARAKKVVVAPRKRANGIAVRVIQAKLSSRTRMATARRVTARVPVAASARVPPRTQASLSEAPPTTAPVAPVAARKACMRDGRVYFLVDCTAELPRHLATADGGT